MYGGIAEPASKTCLCTQCVGVVMVCCTVVCVDVCCMCVDVCCMCIDVCRCVDVWQGWDTTQINK